MTSEVESVAIPSLMPPVTRDVYSNTVCRHKISVLYEERSSWLQNVVFAQDI